MRSLKTIVPILTAFLFLAGAASTTARDEKPIETFTAFAAALGTGQTAIVRIDSTRAIFAVRELGEESIVRRSGDGAVEVEVPCSNLDAFRSWLFGWGVHAEVVAPADVRAGLLDWLHSMAARS